MLSGYGRYGLQTVCCPCSAQHLVHFPWGIRQVEFVNGIHQLAFALQLVGGFLTGFPDQLTVTPDRVCQHRARGAFGLRVDDCSDPLNLKRVMPPEESRVLTRKYACLRASFFYAIKATKEP